MIDVREVRQRFEQLKQERLSWEPMWRDIRDYILPDFGVFEGENPVDGGKRYLRIVDSEATSAADVLAAGLLGGVSSPSRPWLRLTTLDGELDQSPAVKQWLDEVQRTMLLIFAKADVYNQLHQSYLELPVFGQSCTIARPHPTRVVNLQNLTIGEYWFSEDQYGTVDTVYRRIGMTAKQMVQMWGLDAVSNSIRSMYRENPYSRHNVIHAIEPRLERDETKRDAINKPFRSVYFEENAHNAVLSESGFDEFPAMTPRWMTCGGSQYGRGPGAKALSAAKSLQQLQTRLATLVDYITDPPVLVPATFAEDPDLFLPGGRIPVQSAEEAVVRAAWAVGASPESILALINARKEEIHRLFYVNIFQMIAVGQQNDRTATEVAALEQEKVMMLGPVLERLHSELLDPLVSATFAFMLEQNKIPEIPEELEGKTLSVEYISILAEQQKNASAQGIVKLTQEIGMLAQINPESLDKLDTDAAVDALADINGVPPSLIVSGDRVAMIRKARAQNQMQQQQLMQASQQVQNLKDMVPVAESNQLAEMLQQLG